MIYKLEPSSYERVRPLFKGLEHTLITVAVIEKNCPGTIYVDDPENPEIALIVSSEGYYLAGNDKNNEFNKELKELFDTTIIPEKIKEGEENISLNYYPGTWEDKVEEILEGRYPVRVHGYTYKFEKLNILDWKEKIPPGYAIVRIDENFLERTDLKNYDEVINYTKNTWYSFKDFLKKGVGFCIIDDNTIVSWCLTDCVSGYRCEVGVETDEDYRRQGFATVTVSAAVEYLFSQGFTHIDWHTGVANIGSIRTAEKVGFVRVLEDTYHFCWFYPVDNFIEQGYVCWQENNFKESAYWFEKTIAVIESGEDFDSFQLSKYHTVASLYFAAACAWARAGEKDESFRNVYKFVEASTKEQAREQLEMSESLRVYRGTEEWKALLKRLK